LVGGTIWLAICGRRALRFCFMSSHELAMLTSRCSTVALAGQARMASTRARDRARSTSLEGLRDATTLQLLLLSLNDYFGNDACSPGKEDPRY
jgi:hypothetical protein